MRLLVLPVRSIAGTFAWVTSPYVLQRFARDARDAGVQVPAVMPRDCGLSDILITESPTLLAQGNAVYLEDLDLIGRSDQTVRDWSQCLGEILFPEGPAFLPIVLLSCMMISGGSC